MGEILLAAVFAVTVSLVLCEGKRLLALSSSRFKLLHCADAASSIPNHELLPVEEPEVDINSTKTESIEVKKNLFGWIGLDRILIEEPHFEEVVKADQCKSEMRMLGVCLDRRSEVDPTFSIFSQVTINVTIRCHDSRKEGINRVMYVLRVFGKEDEIVETDDDCTNLQIDLEECIVRVVNKNDRRLE